MQEWILLDVSKWREICQISRWFQSTNNQTIPTGCEHCVSIILCINAKHGMVTSIDFLWSWMAICMITYSNGNIFRVTGPLYGELIGYRWIPTTKASDTELWCFLWSAPWINGCINNRDTGDLRRHRAHYDVIVMILREANRWLVDFHPILYLLTQKVDSQCITFQKATVGRCCLRL